MFLDYNLKKIGLHIRLEDSLTKVAEKAARLNLKFFQTFMTLPNGKYINLTDEDLNKFLTLREQFSDIYMHGSYWINLCSAKGKGLEILKRELKIAKKLNFTHLILHPGAATGFETKKQGIQKLAASLNDVLKNENQIQIILENTTHGNKSIGGDLTEYKYLLTLLDNPEKINFCLDSSHAYAYGYDITSEDGLKNFERTIESTIGKENVKLIHLNDTLEQLGSKIDKHEVPGKGTIGSKNLKTFIDIIGTDLPILLEMPPVDEDEEIKIISDVNNWYLC